MIMLKCK